MRKTVLILSILFIAVSAGAQNYLKDITGTNGTILPVLNTSDVCIVKGNTIEVYNKDMELVKTISNLPEFESLLFASYNFFGLSNMYEFIIKKKHYETFRNQLYEENEYRFDFNKHEPYYIVNTRFITREYNETAKTWDFKVYTISGWNKPDPEEPEPINIQEKQNNSTSVYPVPANERVNIAYSISNMQELNIFDTTGKSIETILLDPSQKVYQLNVSKYQPGSYIYRSDSFSGKFIVQ